MRLISKLFNNIATKIIILRNIKDPYNPQREYDMKITIPIGYHLKWGKYRSKTCACIEWLNDTGIPIYIPMDYSIKELENIIRSGKYDNRLVIYNRDYISYWYRNKPWLLVNLYKIHIQCALYDIIDIGAFSNARSLTIYTSIGGERPEFFTTKLLQNHKIKVYSITVPIDAKMFKGVHTVDLQNTTYVKNVDGLKDSHTVNLKYCKGFTDVSSLSKIHTLCIAYTDVSDISALCNLHSLDITSCKNINM